MNKTVQIIIVVDDVPLEDLEVLLDRINASVEMYPDKRVQVSLQDEKMVRR